MFLITPEIGQVYKYPKYPEEFTIKEVRRFSGVFEEEDHWCTDTVLNDLILVSEPKHKSAEECFFLNLLVSIL